MASHIENLPNEIMDLIVAHFNIKDTEATQSRLLQCSKTLQRRLEPWLYSHPESLDKIMRLACIRGSPETIKLAVTTYNASPSTVTVWQGTGSGRPLRPLKVSTLHLAAKKMQSDTFALLVKLGARLDTIRDEKACVVTSQISCIIKALRVDHVKMLHPFLIAGCAEQVQHLSVVNHCLVQAIVNKASIETVSLLLDYGANLNQVQPVNVRMSNQVQAGTVRVNALSAAAMTGATDTFRLLLERGADVNQKRPSLNARSIFEVPVLVAARAMAEFQSTEILQLCFYHGAFLDTGLTLFSERNRYPNSKHPGEFTTPLMEYLEAIVNWQVDFKLPPIQAVSFILHHVRQRRNSLGRTDAAFFESDDLLGGAIELLFQKWGTDYLAVDEFYNVIRFLAVETTKFNPENILNYFLCNDLFSLEERAYRALEILDILLQSRDHAEIGKVLHQLILGCEKFKDQLHQESAEMLIDYLIQSGADINAREQGDDCSRTSLHAVCDAINKETKEREDRFRGCFDQIGQRDIDTRGWLLETIIRKGGDPRLISGGLNALDRLRRTRHEEVGTRIYISHLVGYLNYPGRVLDDLTDFVEFDSLFVDE